MSRNDTKAISRLLGFVGGFAGDAKRTSDWGASEQKAEGVSHPKLARGRTGPPTLELRRISYAAIASVEWWVIQDLNL